MGAPAEELAPGLRLFTVWNYAVFYRASDPGITILRILHGARDLPRFFESSGE
jgi:plasmid stabilization system protein ParE